MKSSETFGASSFADTPSLKSATNGVHDKLGQSTKQLAEHTDSLLQATSALSGETIGALRQQVGKSLTQAREQVMAAERYALQQGRMALSVGESYVRAKPLQALAIAAGIGIIVGLIVRGRAR